MPVFPPAAPGRRRQIVLAALGVAAAVVVAAVLRPAPEAPPPAAARPALTVRLTTPEQSDWPRRLAAHGNVMAWQEAVIGPEVAGYRVSEVLAQVGDRVRRGQVLARIDTAAVSGELAEARATVAELEAAAADARRNAERARALREQGFYSAQTETQYLTAAQTAEARAQAAHARARVAGQRLQWTAVRAPDEGIISARSAVVGSLTQPGQELFRLIRGGRLEWRAEVPAADLGRLVAGMQATLSGPQGEVVNGTVRSVAPAVDPGSRNGVVYVDLPATPALRAGFFARGEFLLGAAPALTVPQSAVVLREGFAYVYRVDPGSERVTQVKVAVGRRQGERTEITAGVVVTDHLVESGAGFLADNDRVAIIEGPAAGNSP